MIIGPVDMLQRFKRSSEEDDWPINTYKLLINKYEYNGLLCFTTKAISFVDADFVHAEQYCLTLG